MSNITTPPRYQPRLAADTQGRDAMGRTYLGALNDHTRWPYKFPFPDVERYRTRPEWLAHYQAAEAAHLCRGVSP